MAVLRRGSTATPLAVAQKSSREQLCTKNGIVTDHAGKPKKADQMNADLASGSVYSKLDQKSITSWLDLRNRAAHGRYGEYTKDQVSLLLQSVRDFMVRVPA